jgi:hypothetical protein
MSHQPWSQAELEQLELIAGDMPRAMAIRIYRSWATKNGQPQRTNQAIEGAIYRYGMSLRATGQWLTMGGIAAVLGISHDCPYRWVQQGLLSATPMGRCQRKVHYVRRSDLVAFARRHPEALGGIERSRLVMLLDDEELAEAIAAEHRHRPWHRKRVVCVETGIVHPTVREAAKAVHVTRQAITYALRTGGTAAGWHWREVAA